MNAIVYDLGGIYKIVCNSQMVNGIWAASEPIFTVNGDSNRDIYEALFSVLAASRKNVLDTDVLSFKDFDKKLGLTKGVKIENVAKSFFVQLEGSTLTFTPCSRERERKTIYYVEKEDESIIIEKLELINNCRELFLSVLKRCE